MTPKELRKFMKKAEKLARSASFDELFEMLGVKTIVEKHITKIGKKKKNEKTRTRR